jgi:hypothetical protein
MLMQARSFQKHLLGFQLGWATKDWGEVENCPEREACAYAPSPNSSHMII